MTGMKSIVSVLLTVALSATTVVAETRLAIGGWSHHYAWKDTITNETHNILALEHEGYSAGYFKNSFDRDTFFVAKNWRWGLSENINLTASLGLNKGYRMCYGDDDSNSNICPHGYLGVEYTKYRVVPTLKMQPGVILFSPEIKF